MSLFTADGQKDKEARSLHAQKSDPDAPARKHYKSGEEAAEARHAELLALFGGMRVSIDKLINDQADLSTRVGGIAQGQDKTNEIVEEVETGVNQASEGHREGSEHQSAGHARESHRVRPVTRPTSRCVPLLTPL